jgi:hypothetical protein
VGVTAKASVQLYNCAVSCNKHGNMVDAGGAAVNLVGISFGTAPIHFEMQSDSFPIRFVSGLDQGCIKYRSGADC